MPEYLFEWHLEMLPRLQAKQSLLQAEASFVGSRSQKAKESITTWQKIYAGASVKPREARTKEEYQEQAGGLFDIS